MDYEQIESSQRQHHEVIRNQEAIREATIGVDYKLFSMLKPEIFKDGDAWCCLLGADLQIGIAGFGKTPYEAVLAWNLEWHCK